jgi:hypothetical protein
VAGFPPKMGWEPRFISSEGLRRRVRDENKLAQTR